MRIEEEASASSSLQEELEAIESELDANRSRTRESFANRMKNLRNDENSVGKNLIT